MTLHLLVLRRMMARSLLWVGMCVVLAGCTLLPPDDAPPAESERYALVLPAGWEAMSDWQPVNVDGDEAEEQLLLFTFDSGQVGALIAEGDAETSISSIEWLLPRYFDEQAQLGQGVIAAPGTLAREIEMAEVEGTNPPRELILLANGTHLTFVWWRGPDQGYGVTQLYAPGGFGVEWETWEDDPIPLAVVLGYYPLQDYRARANLCELKLHSRRTDLPGEVPAIVFVEESQGLHFCGGEIPAHPFAPEGVVMAYLRWPRAGDATMLSLLTQGTSLAQLDAESAAERWSLERVVDIAAYYTLPVAQSEAATATALTTTVCVEFAEVANPNVRRWVLYTLRYQPPDVSQRLGERWTISSALTLPAPVEPPDAGYCDEILARNAP